MKSLLPALLALIPLASAQCEGYTYLPSLPHCALPDLSKYFESNLIPQDQACPNAFGKTYLASATYTDYEDVITTVGLLKPVTSPGDPSETVRFLYDLRFADVKDGSGITVNYYFPRNTLTVYGGVFTFWSTVTYVDATSTRFSTVERTATSTSTITSTPTSTITKYTTITKAVTETTTLKPLTKTITITHKPPKTTKKVYTTKKTTTTLPCIPRANYPRDLVDKLEKRDTIFDSKTFTVPTCYPTQPPKTTLHRSTILTISTITTTSTLTVSTTTTAPAITKTNIKTVIKNTTKRITVTPRVKTVTRNITAARVTVTTRITVWSTVTAYAAKTCCGVKTSTTKRSTTCARSTTRRY
ncbi:hypothetical protein TWF481_008786 [Arthrobotrys musiformis]|uniref:Uncharacterized protein n=1 Tax=Arthrobotrys musiformis TaxID=47236 RepID=A0AAV9W954_9PEZI